MVLIISLPQHMAGFSVSKNQGQGPPYERVVEFNERLLSLIGEYFAPERIDPAASPKYGFHWILTPVDLHPLDE